MKYKIVWTEHHSVELEAKNEEEAKCKWALDEYKEDTHGVDVDNTIGVNIEKIK